MDRMREYSDGSRVYRINREIDLCGTFCPYPQLKTKLALDQMKIGEILNIILDDKLSLENISSCVRQLGDKVIGVEEKMGRYNLIIQRGDRAYKSSLDLKLAE